MRISKRKNSLPVYLDGKFAIYEVTDDPESDYPRLLLRKVKSGISFSELQIFDKSLVAYKSAGIEVERKIRTRPIRLFKKHYIGIGDQIYKVENSVTAINASGFEETDITLSIFTESFELEVVGS
ncbi:hypothetical protein [Alkalibacter mobilis]|uniref:hypothetical protein n=1 Tax=Alkalibacter mobilis TaxID=2787712 RepID=UPI00189D6928|nr:hypothetical protein [Alkalibacter mobilis]MBF7097580.1 hypothetical protein [Alkalibacter mobilis]